MITRIIRLPEAKQNEWILYVRKGQGKNIGNELPGNVRIAEIDLPYLWTQVGLAARTWTDGLDVLWIPAHTLPVLRKPNWRLAGKPLKTVVTIHGIEYEWLPAYENPLQRWYLPLSTRYAVKQATQVIAVSGFTKKQLVERLGADPKKIRVIGNGYEPEENGQKNTEGFAAGERYKLQKGKYFVFVGTVQPRKNLVRLIEAFGRLKYTDYKLIICGKLGWNFAEVQAAAEKTGRNRVIVTGYINENDRRELLRNAVAYVQPSITEGFGIPVLEAMGAGVPVLSSNGGALPEVVGRAGWLFDPMRVEEIRAAMEKIIEDRGLRNRLKNEGKQQVLKFSWESSARQVFELLTYKEKDLK
jgi:glycosyltransferase involved in cell wall biosynthesis